MKYEMVATVDHTGRHTVFVLREDGYFWQFDPHSREWEELPPVPFHSRNEFHTIHRRLQTIGPGYKTVSSDSPMADIDDLVKTVNQLRAIQKPMQIIVNVPYLSYCTTHYAENAILVGEPMWTRLVERIAIAWTHQSDPHPIAQFMGLPVHEFSGKNPIHKAIGLKLLREL